MSEKKHAGGKGNQENAPGSAGKGKSGSQGPGLETGPLASPDYRHIASFSAALGDDAVHHQTGLVGGVVKHLNLVPARRRFR
jgi:hypothetical protein